MKWHESSILMQKVYTPILKFRFKYRSHTSSSIRKYRNFVLFLLLRLPVG